MSDEDKVVGTIIDEEGNAVEVLTRNVGGRPTLFNAAIAERLIAYVKENPSKTSAANFVGISIKTLQVWLKKGRDGDPQFAEFAARFESARDRNKNDMIKRAYDLAMQDQNPAAAIRALQWYYHQFWPEDGEPKKDMKVTMTQELAVKNLSPEDADRLHDMVRKLKDGND